MAGVVGVEEHAGLRFVARRGSLQGAEHGFRLGVEFAVAEGFRQIGKELPTRDVASVELKAGLQRLHGLGDATTAPQRVGKVAPERGVAVVLLDGVEEVVGGAAGLAGGEQGSATGLAKLRRKNIGPDNRAVVPAEGFAPPGGEFVVGLLDQGAECVAGGKGVEEEGLAFHSRGDAGAERGAGGGVAGQTHAEVVVGGGIRGDELVEAEIAQEGGAHAGAEAFAFLGDDRHAGLERVDEGVNAGEGKGVEVEVADLEQLGDVAPRRETDA